MKESPFLKEREWVASNDFAFAIRDAYPVSRGHTLVVPKRRVVSLFSFDLLGCERNEIWALVTQVRDQLVREFSPDAFTIGINDGVVAGQTVMHAHIHIIPRYVGDHPNPRGGVRAVIPGKANY